jgi:hypothetical protein
MYPSSLGVCEIADWFNDLFDYLNYIHSEVRGRIGQPRGFDWAEKMFHGEQIGGEFATEGNGS